MVQRDSGFLALKTKGTVTKSKLDMNWQQSDTFLTKIWKADICETKNIL